MAPPAAPTGLVRREAPVEFLAAEERPVEDDVGHRAERVRPHRTGEHREIGGGVVDEDGGGPERRLHRVEGLGDLLGLADVGARMDGPAPDRLHRGHAGEAVLF